MFNLTVLVKQILLLLFNSDFVLVGYGHLICNAVMIVIIMYHYLLLFICVMLVKSCCDNIRFINVGFRNCSHEGLTATKQTLQYKYYPVVPRSQQLKPFHVTLCMLTVLYNREVCACAFTVSHYTQGPAFHSSYVQVQLISLFYSHSVYLVVLFLGGCCFCFLTGVKVSSPN